MSTIHIYESGIPQEDINAKNDNVLYYSAGSIIGDDDFKYTKTSNPTIAIGTSTGAGIGNIQLGGATGNGSLSSNFLNLNGNTGTRSDSGTGEWAHKGNFAAYNGTFSATATQAGFVTAGNFAIMQQNDATRTANNRLHQMMWYQGAISFNFTPDGGGSAKTWLSATGGNASGISGITSNSGTGSWVHTGQFSATGNVNVQGTLSSTQNLDPAGVTNTGISVGGGPNYAIVNMYDSTRSVNNRTAQEIFFQGSYQIRFANDSGNSAIVPFAISGGQASGITGIASNSGSGSWVHTGTHTVTQASGNSVVLAGSANGGIPSISSDGVNNNVGFQINTKGSGGINLNASTTVIGTFSSTQPAILSPGYSIASLPTGTVGMRAFVTNGKDTTPIFLEPVGATTGTKSWPVFHDGIQWLYA